MAYTLTEQAGIDLVINGDNLDISVDPSEISAQILAAILLEDGAGSGLDADLLDGQHGTYYLDRANHTGTQTASTISDFNTAADARVTAGINSQVTASFVNSLNVDADTVDTYDATSLLARANHTGTQLASTISDLQTVVDADIDARVTKTFVDNLDVDADTLDAQDGAYYLSRANHTGTQTASTISDFQTQVDADIDARVNKAFVDALDVDADTLDSQDGTYYLDRTNHTGTQAATTVDYDNTGHDLIATTVQGAIDELDFKKVDISSLASNVILYPTTTSAGIGPYNKLVTDTADPDYDDPAVDVSTGSITGSDQLVAGFISEPGVIVGNPGVFSITSVGNIRRTAGNDAAQFYFTVIQRDSVGNETIVATSGTTPAIDSSDYEQYAEYALLNNGTFLDTDRIVIKWYATRVGGTTAPTFDIQVGGDDPVRTLLPVPITVIPPETANEVIVDTVAFNGYLSAADDTVQKALNTLDDHTHTYTEVTDFATGVAATVDDTFVEGLGIEIAALDATGAAINYVLTSDGDGTASWQNPLSSVALEQLSDVNYSFGPPVQGDQLIYNETTGTWQPQTPVGSGDMLKSVYDTNDNDIVDKAEAVDDGTYSSSAQEVRELIDSDPVGQAVALAIALG